MELEQTNNVKYLRTLSAERRETKANTAGLTGLACLGVTHILNSIRLEKIYHSDAVQLGNHCNGRRWIGLGMESPKSRKSGSCEQQRGSSVWKSERKTQKRSLAPVLRNGGNPIPTVRPL